MKRVLIVEDEPAVARGLRDNLAYEGLAPTVATSAEEGIDRLRESVPDLLLLDLMLPGQSGFDLLRWMSERDVAPRVIVVSARDAEADVVRALDLGAHDYVRKPFGVVELLARVRAQLREVEESAPTLDEVSVGAATASLRRFRLWRDGEEHLLTHIEVALLRLFLERPDEPLRRADIITRAWGPDAYPSERTVDNFVLKLRKKIEPDPRAPRYLRTVHGHGYRFDPTGEGP